MLKIELLPAGNGDCIWIEYGSDQAVHRVLIDGGVPATAALLKQRLVAIPEESRRFELLVITHIDEDHIGGILKILEDETFNVGWQDIWFNGWKHLRENTNDTLGAVKGERLTDAIQRRGLPWNENFGRKAVVVQPRKPRKVVKLPGGLKITLLGPTADELRRLRPIWKREVERNGLVPGVPPDRSSKRNRKLAPDALGGPNITMLSNKPFASDVAEANGSSITFIAEYRGLRCIFGADAHATTLLEAIGDVAGKGKRLAVDAFKVPHHGSSFNVSSELIRAVVCSRFLFSTNGLKFHHPDPEAIARVIKDGGKGANLYFNYASDQTTIWADAALESRYGYKSHVPTVNKPGLILTLPKLGNGKIQ